MQLCLLHLDDALKTQTDFIATCASDGACEIDLSEAGKGVRLWGRQAELDKISAEIGRQLEKINGSTPKLIFMGSGDFHHITALLLPFALAGSDKPVTVIHFDNHPDWVKFDDGMHCGSWVNRAIANGRVSKVITIGVCSHDLRNPDWKSANLNLLSAGELELFPYNHPPSRVRRDYGSGASYQQKKNHIHWSNIADIGENEFMTKLLARIKTDNVYITIDKDVLDRDDAETNWDQGVMRLPFLLKLLSEIGSRHNIIGADVTGDYSTPRYSGSMARRFLKHAEIFMDQPRSVPDIGKASALNSASNHAILETLAEVMA